MSAEPKPVPAGPKAKRGGRRSAEEGGGTSGQGERRRALREHLAAQFYQAQRNPGLRFKSTAELAAEHEVTEKIIQGDMAYLRDRELLPIKPFRDRGGYAFTEEVKAFAGDEFTRGEYLALWLSVQSFEAWGGLPHQKKMPGIMRKLKSTAAALDPDQLKRMRQRITFKAGGFQAPVEQGIFDTVLRALLQQEELKFGYVSLLRRRELLAASGRISYLRRGAKSPAGQVASSAASAEPPELRHVQPLHLLCYEYAWYLFAWDYARSDVRTFALGRMSGVESTGKPFEPAIKFNLRKELAKSFGITRGGKAVDVHLRVLKPAVPLISERIWHPSAELIENEDGTMDLTLHVAITPELVRWVLSWGDDVVVLAPTALDDQCLKACQRRLEEAAARRGLRWSIGGQG